MYIKLRVSEFGRSTEATDAEDSTRNAYKSPRYVQCGVVVSYGGKVQKHAFVKRLTCSSMCRRLFVATKHIQHKPTMGFCRTCSSRRYSVSLGEF